MSFKIHEEEKHQIYTVHASMTNTGLWGFAQPASFGFLLQIQVILFLFLNQVQDSYIITGGVLLRGAQFCESSGWHLL